MIAAGRDAKKLAANKTRDWRGCQRGEKQTTLFFMVRPGAVP